MRDLKVSVGVWFLGAVGDRFVKQGYRPDKTIEERFRLAASVDGVRGLEMHYPTEIDDDNWRTLKQIAGDSNLKFVMLTPHVWVDPRFAFGQFSHPEARVRSECLDFCKRVTDFAQKLDVEFMCYWPAQDGYEYPFQIDYRKRWDDLAEGLAAWADHNPAQKIVVEYKGYDPRAHILLPTVGQCVAMLREIDRPNLGINIETGHALIMKENLAEAFGFCMRYGKLFHTHWNDNTKMFDDDLIPGMVNFWETLELLFWLEEWGYDGWYGLDLFPYREDPAKAVAESIRNLNFGFECLDRVPREELRKVMRTSDAIEIARLQRRMLGVADVGKIGLQLYTVREEAARDLCGTLRAVSEMGYEGVEFAGVPTAPAAAIRDLLAELTLEPAGIVSPMPQLQDKAAFEAAIAYNRAIGSRTILFPWLDPPYRQNIESYLAVAALFNRVGRVCRERDLQFLYHIHGYEFSDLGGCSGLEILMEHCDPEPVGLELDTYWVEHAGQDALAVYERYADRCYSIHFKDMKDRVEMRDVEVGEGVVDTSGILRAAQGRPAEWFIVEQEQFDRPPLESAAISCRNLKRLAEDAARSVPFASSRGT